MREALTTAIQAFNLKMNMSALNEKGFSKGNTKKSIAL